MRPLALPHRLNGYEERCDYEGCRRIIPLGEAKLITRDNQNITRRFCGAGCFDAWAKANAPDFFRR